MQKYASILFIKYMQLWEMWEKRYILFCVHSTQ